jgi:hypothetical protein
VHAGGELLRIDRFAPELDRLLDGFAARLGR